MAFPLQFTVQSVILNCYSTLLTPLVLLHQKTWVILTVHGYNDRLLARLLLLSCPIAHLPAKLLYNLGLL